MKECYIDMHCHILPGVDDGAKDLAETKKMLEIAYAEGIRCIIATPPWKSKACARSSTRDRRTLPGIPWNGSLFRTGCCR